MKTFLGILVLVAPPDPLYQMTNFQESFHLAKNKSSRATSETDGAVQGLPSTN